jgi:putative ABC transport system ATP-binding protein
VTGDGAVLALRGVQKGFGTGAGAVQVLDDVDLLVQAGEIVAVAGRSGSGKTTMLTLAAGFEAPDAGQVELLGRPVGGAPPWRELAVVPQSLGLLDELTVAENVALPGRLGGTDHRTHDQELLEHLGIAHLASRFPDEISLGEQQRVALARAAVSLPRVLVADEPISHQNEGWAQTVMLVIERLADAGTACLVATHNEIAFGSSHRILELRDGRLADSSATSAPSPQAVEG